MISAGEVFLQQSAPTPDDLRAQPAVAQDPSFHHSKRSTKLCAELHIFMCARPISFLLRAASRGTVARREARLRGYRAAATWSQRHIVKTPTWDAAQRGAGADLADIHRCSSIAGGET
jgi:hypothetical protein